MIENVLGLRFFTAIPSKMSLKKMSFTSKVDNFEEVEENAMSVLDLPDLVLECILERLPPAALCNMAVFAAL
ncbi:hypothetical protein F3Y22_tig00116997pilonHSYRG00190 [Hibiscus syriacus]|uniref:F-box domain-containing protein n=1 Tax=Hibiscus syriacus TaxID=106335 RepID=A0A6A2WG62_HIBSY|nr:hypothetical protein F3Y22_tig00116997pilonHSYRG00190 [Hibiscus syriacus]